jgi:hypothetical protein
MTDGQSSSCSSPDELPKIRNKSARIKELKVDDDPADVPQTSRRQKTDKKA